jgi:hypothetical protein
MTIAAIELDYALGPLQVLFEMNLVVEFDAAGVDISWPQGRELGMSHGKRVDVSSDSDLPALGLQVPMASDAGLGSGGKKLCGSFVFDMALGAGGRPCLLFLMDRAIVADGARLVGDSCSQDVPAQVASTAVLAERSMMGRQGPAAE